MKDFEEVKREETADSHPFSFFSSPSVQDRVIDALYHDTVKKGERVVDVSKMDPKAANILSKALTDFGMNDKPKNGFEEMMMKEFDSFLDGHPETNEMSPEELMDYLHLSAEDKKVVQEDIQKSIDKVEHDLEAVDLQSLLPDAEESLGDFMSAIDKAVSADPSLSKEVDEWMRRAQSHLGNDLKGMESLSDEEFAKIALPPLRLRNAMKSFLPDKNRMGDLNLNATDDSRDLFMLKK